jgi:predicted metal-dependent phosphoesterase TrpH
LIDLHTHTTASDGRLSPAELVARAAAAGVHVLAITDHDTVAGCEAGAAACSAAGIEFVAGIEMTSVVDERDVHVLGYFIDPHFHELQTYLADERQRRINRVRQMIERLAAHGMPVDADAILAPTLSDSGKAAGRPWIARALVASGYVSSTQEAFDRWLARDRPAFVPRVGSGPADVFRRIHEAGGIASLAHPALLRRDELIPGFAADGVDALEAYHSEHDAEATARYLAVAERLGIAVSGGSDFHGDDTHGPGGPGSVSLPRDRFEALRRLVSPKARTPGFTVG